MKNIFILGLIVSLLLFSACHTPTQEETLLKTAFEAFKEGDWEKFKNEVKVSSDHDLKSQGLRSPLKQSMSYSSKMKEEEFQRMHQTFIRIVNHEDGWIDFKKAEYDGFLVLSESESTETIAGDQVPTKFYAFKIKGEGGVAKYPQLAVAQWGSFQQIIDIIVPEEEYEE